MKDQLPKENMLYIALLHYPVINKEGKVVTTAIANMDIHDIARTAKTFGVKRFYVINPVERSESLPARSSVIGGTVTAPPIIHPEKMLSKRWKSDPVWMKSCPRSPQQMTADRRSLSPELISGASC